MINTFEAGKKKAYLSTPAVEYQELEEHIDASFVKLREFIEQQYYVQKPWLALVELD